MGWTILARDLVAHGTFLTRIPGIHHNYGDTSQPCLVAHKLPQLEKSPVGVSCPLLASGLNPGANPLQIFQGDGGPGALRRFHDTLGDGMVDVLLKPGLCARELPQLASGGPRGMVLQFLASLGKALPFPLDLGTAIDSAIRIDRQVDNAKKSAMIVVSATDSDNSLEQRGVCLWL